jgi:hypothetical protein
MKKQNRIFFMLLPAALAMLAAPLTVPVPSSAIGVGAGMFNSYYDNTDIGKKVMHIMNVSERVAWFPQWVESGDALPGRGDHPSRPSSAD